MILQVSFKSSSIICTADDTISSISNQTACKSSHNISAHECALNQSTYSSTNIVQTDINYQTMILQVSYKSSCIICMQMTQLLQHLQPNSMQILSQYICAWMLSINPQTVQLTIVQTDINYQTMILQVLQIKLHYMHCKWAISSAFQTKQHANLTQYIYAWMRSQSINIQFN